jgi:hypothetical protein
MVSVCLYALFAPFFGDCRSESSQAAGGVLAGFSIYNAILIERAIANNDLNATNGLLNVSLFASCNLSFTGNTSIQGVDFRTPFNLTRGINGALGALGLLTFIIAITTICSAIRENSCCLCFVGTAPPLCSCRRWASCSPSSASS